MKLEDKYKRRMVAWLTFLLQLQLLKGQQYEIVFERTDDYITLKCRNITSQTFLRVSSDQNTRFWLNLTNSVRPDGHEPDIRTRLRGPMLAEGRDSVGFIINVDLEGRYTCGRTADGNGANAVESESMNELLLVCK